MSNVIMTISVKTFKAQSLEGKNSKVVMIPFKAEATGEYFCGKTVEYGIDTQKTTKNGFSLSARYMLEGTDCSGKKCRVFIENNGTSLENCRPKIYTDSEALAFLEESLLTASISCVENGVIVQILM